MKRILTIAAGVLVAVALAVPTAISSATARSAPAPDVRTATSPSADYQLAGTWVYRVQLGAPPGQPTPPPFHATFVYTGDGSIIEITSRAGNLSAGLGVWKKTGPSTYRTKFYKYRFDGTGAYVGKTVVRETLVLSSRRHVTSTSTTDIYNASGDLVTHLENTAEGRRVRIAA